MGSCPSAPEGMLCNVWLPSCPGWACVWGELPAPVCSHRWCRGAPGRAGREVAGLWASMGRQSILCPPESTARAELEALKDHEHLLPLDAPAARALPFVHCPRRAGACPAALPHSPKVVAAFGAWLCKAVTQAFLRCSLRGPPAVGMFSCPTPSTPGAFRSQTHHGPCPARPAPWASWERGWLQRRKPRWGSSVGGSASWALPCDWPWLAVCVALGPLGHQLLEPELPAPPSRLAPQPLHQRLRLLGAVLSSPSAVIVITHAVLFVWERDPRGDGTLLSRDVEFLFNQISSSSTSLVQLR